MDAMASQNDLQKRAFEIQTFVFFDLETTGFIQGSNMPKITEIALVASSRNSLLSKNELLPRVMHKLTIPIQPMRPIPIEVSQITGLYNDLLEDEKPFDEQMYELLHSFIARLSPPICFVAHNGNRFDYPIFLSTLNLIGKALSNDILCIDSLIAFRTLFNDSNYPSTISVSSKSVKEDSNWFEDGYDHILAKIVDLHSNYSTSLELENVEVTGEKCEMNPQSMQKVNETTPTHQINKSMRKINHKLIKKIDGITVRKRLPFTQSRPDDYKLGTIYKHLVGDAPLESHCAEADCLSMLTCVMKIGESFIRWADLNASPLVQYAVKQK